VQVARGVLGSRDGGIRKASRCLLQPAPRSPFANVVAEQVFT